MAKNVKQLEGDVAWWDAELQIRKRGVLEAERNLEQRKRELAEATRYEQERKENK